VSRGQRGGSPTVVNLSFLDRKSTYIDEIIMDHQCGFRRNRSTVDQIFCICQILGEKWKYNEAVHQLSLHFKKSYDSMKREVFVGC
jgi:hypothetical protein